MLADMVLKQIEELLEERNDEGMLWLSKARLIRWRDALTRDAQQRTGAERGAGSDKPANQDDLWT